MRCLLLTSLALSLVACGTTTTSSAPAQSQSAKPAVVHTTDTPVTNPGDTPARAAAPDSSYAH